jgi:hypothetical protein
MFNSGLDDMFFAYHFVDGLKEDIKGGVQSQLPDTVDKASILARIQQQILDRAKAKPIRISNNKVAAISSKPESTLGNTGNTMWKERQLRDYRRDNKLCYFCGDKFDAACL